MATNEVDPYPSLDLNDLIGLPRDAAVALAEAKGVERIRVVEIADGVTVGAIDLVLTPTRLDLASEDGHVVFAMFPTRRSAGVWPAQPGKV